MNSTDSAVNTTQLWSEYKVEPSPIQIGTSPADALWCRKLIGVVRWRLECGVAKEYAFEILDPEFCTMPSASPLLPLD